MPKVEILQQKKHKFLWIGDTLMMHDIPIERRIQKKIAKKAWGDVLVAGYGLGIVQEYLLKNPKVKSVISIEKLPDVVKERKRVYGKLNGEIIIANFFKYKTDKKFDCVIGDTWAEINEESLEEYKKFKVKAQQLIKPNGKVLAWGQEFFEYLIKKNAKKRKTKNTCLDYRRL